MIRNLVLLAYHCEFVFLYKSNYFLILWSGAPLSYFLSLSLSLGKITVNVILHILLNLKNVHFLLLRLWGYRTPSSYFYEKTFLLRKLQKGFLDQI